MEYLVNPVDMQGIGVASSACPLCMTNATQCGGVSCPFNGVCFHGGGDLPCNHIGSLSIEV